MQRLVPVPMTIARIKADKKNVSISTAIIVKFGAGNDLDKGRKENKMRHYQSLLVSIPALLFASALLPAENIAVQLTGVGPSDGQYYVLPYQLSINGVETNAICYDFEDEISMNQTWSANLLTLDGAAAGGQFSYLGPTLALADYEQVAWLSSLYFAGPALATEDEIDLQHAIWDVFDPTAFNLPANAFLTNVQATEAAGIAGLDFDNYQFLEAIPENGGQAQSFVLYTGGDNNNTNPTTPEPGAAVLLFVGLGLIGVSKMREVRKNANR